MFDTRPGYATPHDTRRETPREDASRWLEDRRQTRTARAPRRLPQSVAA
ncbi:MAG: hypothetical protein ACFBWO_01090 [Paracoccaceae bacterium]